MWTVKYRGCYIHGHFNRSTVQLQIMTAPAGSFLLRTHASRDAAERWVRRNLGA